jgi:hypothetical protein
VIDACVRVCVRVCVRACVPACVRVSASVYCIRVCVRVRRVACMQNKVEELVKRTQVFTIDDPRVEFAVAAQVRPC